MRNRTLSSPPTERIDGVSWADRALVALSLFAASGCGSSLSASVERPDVAALRSRAAATTAGEVRRNDLPSGYAWNFDRRISGLSATLDLVTDPSLCGDGIDESWSRLRESLDRLDNEIRTSSGSLVTPDTTSNVWVQAIEPIDRMLATFSRKDSKIGGDLKAGVASWGLGGTAGIHRSESADELVLGRQTYEVRLTNEAVACIRLNASRMSRGQAPPPVWDRIVYGAVEQTLVRASVLDGGGGLDAPMLRVVGKLNESEISARVDMLGGHSRENTSGAPEVKRLLTEQRLNELLAQTNQYYDRTAIIAVHEEAGLVAEPMPVLSLASADGGASPPETVVYFANTNDNDLELWSSALPRGLCVVSRGGSPIEDEAAVRAAVKRDISQWFDTGEVKTKGDCAPIRGPKPIRYFLVNALTGRSYQIDPNEASRHYHFKAMLSSAAAAEAIALAAKAELSPKQRNLWLLDKLRSGGDSLDARGLLPVARDDAASELRTAYYDRLLEASYPSAADAFRVLRSIVRLRGPGRSSQSALRAMEGPILRVLAGRSSKELPLRAWWPSAGNDCKFQWHDDKANSEGSSQEGEWRLFCRGHLLRLSAMEVWSSDVPSDIASPDLITIGAEPGRGADADGAEASKQGKPQPYGYILGDLLFFRRDTLPEVLKALGAQMSKNSPGKLYAIKAGATSGLEWSVTESFVSEVAVALDAPLSTAVSRCARHYAQGQLAQLVCEAPQGYMIDQERLGASVGLSCRGESTVVCTSRGSRSVFGRPSSGLSIPLLAVPPVPPPASDGGGA